MDVIKHNERLDLIETIIDEQDLTGLMDLVSEVCSAKADHIRMNWQDDITANHWDGLAAGFLKCSLTPTNLPFIEQEQ